MLAVGGIKAWFGRQSEWNRVCMGLGGWRRLLVLRSKDGGEVR